jgi:Abortive infection C-terminus
VITDVARENPFVMHSAREAVAGGLGHIEQQVDALERAIFENPSLAFDLAKTLVESVCRTILDERSVPYETRDDLPRIFKAATRSLPFLPAGASAEGDIRKSLAQTLGGLHTSLQGICELRNHAGFASHGAGGARPALESVQALLAAQSADAIVGFVHRMHRQDQVVRRGDSFDDNEAFNASVDEVHGFVRIFEVEFRPSEVLYAMEPETYRLYATEYNAANRTPELTKTLVTSDDDL